MLLALAFPLCLSLCLFLFNLPLPFAFPLSCAMMGADLLGSLPPDTRQQSRRSPAQSEWGSAALSAPHTQSSSPPQTHQMSCRCTKHSLAPTQQAFDESQLLAFATADVMSVVRTALNLYLPRHGESNINPEQKAGDLIPEGFTATDIMKAQQLERAAVLKQQHKGLQRKGPPYSVKANSVKANSVKAPTHSDSICTGLPQAALDLEVPIMMPESATFLCTSTTG